MADEIKQERKSRVKAATVMASRGDCTKDWLAAVAGRNATLGMLKGRDFFSGKIKVESEANSNPCLEEFEAARRAITASRKDGQVYKNNLADAMDTLYQCAEKNKKHFDEAATQ